MQFDQQKLNAELSLDEGRRANVYLDSVGIPTVGIGHNLNIGPLPGQTYPMTDAEIDALFAKDVAIAVAALDAHLPWWRSLDDVRQRVMLNMTFNLGIGTLLTFTTFLGMVEHGQYADAATDMLHTLWARQVGNRAQRLSVMMRTGSVVPSMAPFPPTPLGTHTQPFPPLPRPTPMQPAKPAPQGLWQALMAILSAILSLFKRKL